MKSNAIQFLGAVVDRSRASSKLRNPGDLVLIKRGDHIRWAVLRCPSGCGDDVVLNLDRRAGDAWSLFNRRGKLTIFPSIWRDSGCGSHFIVWNNRVVWCDFDETPFESEETLDPIDSNSIIEVLQGNSELVSYETIADKLGAIPWCLTSAEMGAS